MRDFIQYKITMSANKYDRETLKGQFFQAEELDVKTWWEGMGKGYSSVITRNTSGWKDEKKKRKEGLVDKVMEVAEQEFIETYKPDIKELGKYHKLIMGIVAKKLVSMAKKEKDADEIYVGDVEKLWKMIKVEKNEPTAVTKTTGDIKVIPISEEDKEMVDKLLDANM